MTTTKPSKTILVLAANPTNTPALRLDQEVREIENGLQRAQRRDDFALRQSWATRPIDVRRAMLDHKPNFVHFCGHGVAEEGLAFEDDSGQAKLVSADALAGFFKLFAETVECVVLNACYSEPQAEAIARHISHVVGMKKEISDLAATEFAVAFYDALGAGQSVEFAYDLACNAIQWSDATENLTPTLITKPRSSRQQEKLLEDRIELHLTPKLPCLLLLDISSSMSGEPIQALTRAVRSFVDDLLGSPLALERVDFALITFGSLASIVWDFAPISEFHMPSLDASGATATGEAIKLGLDLLERKKQEYKRKGVPYYQPLVLLLTGGSPTDDWRASVNRLHRESSLKKLRFITVGTEAADMEVLNEISPPGTKPLGLKHLRFSDMFLWLSSSIDSVSREELAETIEFPSPARMVSVPGHPQLQIPYNELLEYEAVGDDDYKIVVEGRVVKLSVSELLDSVDLPSYRRDPPDRLGPFQRAFVAKRDPLSLFISYSHRDDRFRDELRGALAAYERLGEIDSWDDTDIVPGQKWERGILDKLERADIIVLLLSNGFISSDYCYAKEMKRAIERDAAGDCAIVPVVVRACNFAKLALGKIQAILPNGKPVEQHKYRDAAWLEVTKQLDRVIADLKKKRQSS